MARAILFSFLPRRSAAASSGPLPWTAARSIDEPIGDPHCCNPRRTRGECEDWRFRSWRTGPRLLSLRAPTRTAASTCKAQGRTTSADRPARAPMRQPGGSRRAPNPSLPRRRYDGAATRGAGAREAVSPVGGCALPSHAARSGDQISRPAMAAQTKVAMLPPTMALRPRRARSPRRSGARPAMPPIWMAMELKLAKPHRA